MSYCNLSTFSSRTRDIWTPAPLSGPATKKKDFLFPYLGGHHALVGSHEAAEARDGEVLRPTPPDT